MDTPRIEGSLDLQPAPERRPAAGAADFGSTLGHALEGVEALQQQADAQSSALAHGAGNLHETALALEKADVAMRLAVKVRNKVVDAYQDVMRMSV